MLGGALGQLFLDLDQIPAAERSEYEQQLHQELFELAQRLRPLASLRNLTTAALRTAITTNADLRLEVDLRPDDVTRLKCKLPNCPNKRI